MPTSNQGQQRQSTTTTTRSAGTGARASAGASARASSAGASARANAANRKKRGEVLCLGHVVEHKRYWYRICEALSLILDETLAVYAIIGFSGVTDCCDKPIVPFSNGVTALANFHTVVRYITYAHAGIIVLEAYPVIIKEMTFNIFNPVIGVLIAATTFFQDGMRQALIVWGLEATAVALQYIAFRFLKGMVKEEIIFFRRPRARASATADVEHGASSRPNGGRSSQNKKAKTSTTTTTSATEDEDSTDNKYGMKRSDLLRVMIYVRFFAYLSIVLCVALLAFILYFGFRGGVCIIDEQITVDWLGLGAMQCGELNCTNAATEKCELCRPDVNVDQCFKSFAFND